MKIIKIMLNSNENILFFDKLLIFFKTDQIFQCNAYFKGRFLIKKYYFLVFVFGVFWIFLIF
jgi:hypothetical protein